MEYKPKIKISAFAIAVAALLAGAQTPVNVNAAEKAPASAPAQERYLLHIEVPEIAIYEKPDTGSLVVGRLEQGIEVEADRKSGDWYRIKRRSGEDGWVQNTVRATGPVMVVRPFPPDTRLAYEAANIDPRVPESLPREKIEAQAAAQKLEQPAIDRSRPQGFNIEPRVPLIDRKRITPTSPLFLSEEMPIRDRWRLVKALGLLPYDPLDP